VEDRSRLRKAAVMEREGSRAARKDTNRVFFFSGIVRLSLFRVKLRPLGCAESERHRQRDQDPHGREPAARRDDVHY